ncbi:uncharacterized protein [Onthophagus taurus]|uniref:uncharacterized protein isoform X1 n=1 Tax=Onthophagus taurus TaxID=166361 RepID=UPI000C205114|nr:uncharacterized protein LOC111418288 isoform X1 [Onthophagus taurus]
MDKQKLIQLVREYRCLYDNNDKYYSDLDKKEIAWREIGQKLHQTAECCKQTWNYIRDGYRRILKKRKRSGGSSKKWKFEDEVFFLLPFLKQKERNNPSSSNNTISVFDDSWNASVILDDDNTGDQESDEEKGLKCISSSTLRIPIKRKSQLSGPALMNILHEKKSKNESLDDVDLFFASLAKTVKQFTPINRAVAKQKVFNLIFEIEKEELENKD